jgi:hypothetical protein
MFTLAASRTPFHARNRLSGCARNREITAQHRKANISRRSGSGPVGGTSVHIIRIGIHARITPSSIIP